MRIPVLLAVAAVGAAGLLAPAQAATIAPTNQKTFLHCPGGAQEKVINAAPLSDGAVTGWDGTAPTVSVTAGGGCGFAETGPLSGTGMQTVYDFPAEGAVTGPVGSMTLRFHVINAAPSRATNTATLGLRLTVDGQSLFGSTATGDSAAVPVRVTLVPSATGVSSEAVVTVTGVGLVEPADATEAGEHSVAFAVSATSDVVTGFVLDTVETPSGIEFNPAAPAGTSVTASTPYAPPSA